MNGSTHADPTPPHPTPLNPPRPDKTKQNNKIMMRRTIATSLQTFVSLLDWKLERIY
jgi:hypothetical protein